MTTPARLPFAARLRLLRNKRYDDWWHIVFGGPLGVRVAALVADVRWISGGEAGPDRDQAPALAKGQAGDDAAIARRRRQHQRDTPAGAAHVAHVRPSARTPSTTWRNDARSAEVRVRGDATA